MDYEIADITLADFGNKEIELANIEMPRLMALQKKHGESKPLAGVKISGSLHMTIQTAVLIQTLKKLGADVRWCSCNIYSTQDHAAIALNEDTAVFAWKGESLEEYWECTLMALTWPLDGGDVRGPDMFVDDGSDATFLVDEGLKWENIYKTEDKRLPDPQTAPNEEHRIVLEMIRTQILKDVHFWGILAKPIKGVSEETTTTGVKRLMDMEKDGSLLFPAVNVNDSVTKFKFDNVYGCRHSCCDAIYRATDVMIAGKKALVLGFGDVGKGSADSLRSAGATVYVTEIDPICALQACMQGYQVVRLEDIIGEIDVFVTASGN